MLGLSVSALTVGWWVAKTLAWRFPMLAIKVGVWILL